MVGEETVEAWATCKPGDEGDEVSSFGPHVPASFQARRQVLRAGLLTAGWASTCTEEKKGQCTGLRSRRALKQSANVSRRQGPRRFRGLCGGCMKLSAAHAECQGSGP